MADLSLVFDILARDRASSELNHVGDTAERTGQRVVGGLKVIAGGLLGLGIIEGFRELYDAAAESQRIGRLTESTIASTGGAANVTAMQVGDLAAAISAKTGIDDEAIQSGQNLLLTFTKIRNETGAGNDIFNQATSILADMSTVLGTDASGSAVQLGKALNDPIAGIGSLSRAGVQFTAQQKDQIRTLVESGDILGAQKIILAELTTQFGGAAENASTPLGKMQVAIGNVAEELGAYLVPAVEGGADAVLNIIAGFESGVVTAGGFDGVMQQVGVTVGDVADGVGFLVGVGQGFVGVIDAIPGPVLAGVGAMTALALLKGPVGSAFTTIAGTALASSTSLVAATTSMVGARVAANNLIGVMGGPWGIALGAGVAAVALVSSEISDASAQTDSWAQAVLAGGASVQTALSQAAAERDKYGDNFIGDFSYEVDQFFGLASSMEDAQQQARDLYAAMNPLQQAQQNVTHDTNELAAAIERYGENSPQARDAAEALARSNERVAERQAAVTRATDEATAAMNPAAAASAQLAASQQQLAADTGAAKQMIDAIRLALEQLQGDTVETTELESAFYAAVAEAATATDNLTGSVLNAAWGINTQSEAGRAAGATFRDVAADAIALISNQAALGESHDLLTARSAGLREQFILAAGEMGITGQAAENLATEYLGVPGEIVTTAELNAGSALTAIGTVRSAMNSIDGLVSRMRVQVAVSQVAGLFGFGPGAAIGGQIADVVRGFSTGGKIDGPGGPTDDLVPALTYGGSPLLVSDDEWVIRAASAASYGDRKMAAVNAGTARIEIPGFATGGRPGYTSPIETLLTPTYDLVTTATVPVGGAAPGGAAATGAAVAGPATFEGNLYLDSGEFLGKVRGVAGEMIEDTLNCITDMYFNHGGR